MEKTPAQIEISRMDRSSQLSEQDLKLAKLFATRRRVLDALNLARPYPVSEEVLYEFALQVDPRTTRKELRAELQYLVDLGLTSVESINRGSVLMLELTAAGFDLLEYNAPCPPGISRSPRS